MKKALAAVLGLSLVGAAPATPPPAAKRGPALAQALAGTAHGGKLLAWVFFADKGPGAEARATQAVALMTPRAASRRRIRGQVAGPTMEDLPVFSAYVDQVAGRVERVRRRSGGRTGVGGVPPPARSEAVEALGFVARRALVRRYRGRAEEPARPEPEVPGRSSSAGRAPRASSPFAIDYGRSINQLS